MRSKRIRSGKVDVFGKVVRYCAVLIGAIAVLGFAITSQAGVQPVMTCDSNPGGIGTVTLTADVSGVTITGVSTGTTTLGVGYCLVKVLVPQAINIWVGLPMGGTGWNERLQSEGGGGYAGSVGIPVNSINGGYVGIQTDTGHTGGSGTFGMLYPAVGTTPGAPNIPLQEDFAYRSEHLMAVIGKQLAGFFYGEQPVYSYWNGCSTGGRQGLAMAQRYPQDYNGILSGAPAIHFDRFQAEMLWPQMVQYLDTGGIISTAKKTLATNAAIAACDALDGVVDGIIGDPRACTYDAQRLVTKTCTSSDATCLTQAEAGAINKMWFGATNEKGNKFFWYGQTRGTNLDGVGGVIPFSISIAQPRYWVYFDPTWDFHVQLNYANYETFFDYTIAQMAAGGTPTDNPNLAPFRNAGGKIIMWHGFSDQLIMPEGTIDYYDAVVSALGGGYSHVQDFARLFMAPGVAHCGGGVGPAPQNPFNYVVNWVENGVAPDTILAVHTTGGTIDLTRPLCPYPDVAVWTGQGSTSDAANFVCKRGKDNYPHRNRQTTP
jgi:hypothetical protein